MLRVLTKDDIGLIHEFYDHIGVLNKNAITTLYQDLDDTKVVCAYLRDNKISSLIITSIIKHNYYLEKIAITHEDILEIKDLVSFTIRELRKDERGINIIYDNFPYSRLMHQIMLENGFKCNYINLINLRRQDKIELIKPNIALNDKSEDVKTFIYNNLVEEVKSNIATGVNIDIPSPDSVHLENTNVAVIRDNANQVIGTVRFSIVSNSLYLSNLYGESNNVISDLLSLVKNLTTRNIEIGLYPNNSRIIELLEHNGFIKYQTDYILRLQ